MMHGSTLSRAVAKWVSETFQVLSVNIWLVDDSREHLIYGASTSFPEAEIEKRLKVQTGPEGIAEALGRRPYPFDVNETKEKCLEALKLHHPDAFRNRGCRVCVPMIASGELLGLMIVGDRVNGTPFSAEDMDLLKCIGDQVAGDLLNIRLSASLLQAKEMEAFQTMSAFFVHDLKNTVFTLSLLLENLPEHFEKPEFRGDMLRALAKCVSRINHLISRLGLLRHELELKRTEADLNDVVGKALANLGGLLQVQVTSHLRPIPNLSIDPEQIQKVINNLLVNAIEAVGKTGLVHVETSTRNGWIQLSVKDNGCGMSPEFVAGSLFRPFQTTKKRGIGIGMFLSKMIVDAHEGRVEVESHIGKGTTFHLLLPLQGAPN
jgi:putative PEP-CTERM system histidine kinase